MPWCANYMQNKIRPGNTLCTLKTEIIQVSMICTHKWCGVIQLILNLHCWWFHVYLWGWENYLHTTLSIIHTCKGPHPERGWICWMNFCANGLRIVSKNSILLLHVLFIAGFSHVFFICKVFATSSMLVLKRHIPVDEYSITTSFVATW